MQPSGSPPPPTLTPPSSASSPHHDPSNLYNLFVTELHYKLTHYRQDRIRKDTAGFIELYPPAASFSDVNPYAPGLITPDGGKPQSGALPSAGDPPRRKFTKEEMAQLQLEDEFIQHVLAFRFDGSMPANYEYEKELKKVARNC